MYPILIPFWKVLTVVTVSRLTGEMKEGDGGERINIKSAKCVCAQLRKKLKMLNKEEKMTSTDLELDAGQVDNAQFDHTPYYCEENVYFLCKKLCQHGIADAEGSDLFVAFISNEKKQVPLWHQKASKRADGIILWDYHVICIQKKRDVESPFLVWDLDSSLPFPSPLPLYISETIRPSFQLFADYQRFFRIVHAPLFLHYFASDRRHLKDSAGNWVAQPPAYEPIEAKDGTVHNLNEYIEIHASDELTNLGADSINLVFTQKHGVVIGESRLEEFFLQIS